MTDDKQTKNLGGRPPTLIHSRKHISFDASPDEVTFILESIPDTRQRTEILLKAAEEITGRSLR